MVSREGGDLGIGAHGGRGQYGDPAVCDDRMIENSGITAGGCHRWIGQLRSRQSATMRDEATY